MKPAVCVVTGNAGKWAMAQATMGDVLALERHALETPELQSLDVVEVARFSALWAAKELGRPVLKTDVGYYVAALGGFPGPLVKWMNQTLEPADVLAMMVGKADRRMVIREALVYAEPGGFSMAVQVERPCTILAEVRDSVEGGSASVFDRIAQEDALPEPFASMTFEAQIAYLSRLVAPVYGDMAARIVERAAA